MQLLTDMMTKKGDRIGNRSVRSITPVSADKIYGKVIQGPHGERLRQGEKLVVLCRRAWKVVHRLYPDQFDRDVPNAERAAGLGWDAMALFGCAPKRPIDYSGSAGLLWVITGGRLVELHRDWAVIDLPVNRSQRIFYRRNVDPAKITLPWLKQASFR
jgi:hypothetical protein